MSMYGVVVTMLHVMPVSLTSVGILLIQSPTLPFPFECSQLYVGSKLLSYIAQFTSGSHVPWLNQG